MNTLIITMGIIKRKRLKIKEQQRMFKGEDTTFYELIEGNESKGLYISRDKCEEALKKLRALNYGTKISNSKKSGGDRGHYAAHKLFTSELSY